jgi:hypothetical protein
MEYYSVTRKSEIMSFVEKWIELENIMLREISQAQKANTSHSCSFVDTRPKMRIQLLLLLLLLIMGHKCKWRTV